MEWLRGPKDQPARVRDRAWHGRTFDHLGRCCPTREIGLDRAIAARIQSDPRRPIIYLARFARR